VAAHSQEEDTLPVADSLAESCRVQLHHSQGIKLLPKCINNVLQTSICSQRVADSPRAAGSRLAAQVEPVQTVLRAVGASSQQRMGMIKIGYFANMECLAHHQSNDKNTWVPNPKDVGKHSICIDHHQKLQQYQTRATNTTIKPGGASCSFLPSHGIFPHLRRRCILLGVVIRRHRIS